MEPASARASERLGTMLAAVSAATFGFGTTCSRLAYEGGSAPLTVVFFRLLAFVVVVGLFLLAWRRGARLRRQAVVTTLWMAGALITVSLGYQGSVAFIPVSLAALLFYSFPLMVGVMAVAAGRERMTLLKAAALVACFVGLGLAMGAGFDALDWRGALCALAAALAMALVLTFGGEATRGEDLLTINFYTNVWMLLALGLVTIALGGPALPTTATGLAGLAGVCVVYVVAFLTWFFALGRVIPVRLAVLFNIEPLVTLIVASLVLGERLSPVQLAGAGLLFAAILSVTLSRSRAMS
jgi:drug/metabolite transporter (DMT)-like permease